MAGGPWVAQSFARPGIDYVKGGAEPPPMSYVLTFDDCYLDNWVHAAPILRESGVRASFGCVTAYLHDGPRRPDASMPEADLRELPVARDAAPVPEASSSSSSRGSWTAVFWPSPGGISRTWRCFP